jgi:hypothetical protein
MWDNEWTFLSTHNTLCFVGYDIGAYIAPMPHAPWTPPPFKLIKWQQNIYKNNLGNFQTQNIKTIMVGKYVVDVSIP